MNKCPKTRFKNSGVWIRFREWQIQSQLPLHLTTRLRWNVMLPNWAIWRILCINVDIESPEASDMESEVATDGIVVGGKVSCGGGRPVFMASPEFTGKSSTGSRCNSCTAAAGGEELSSPKMDAGATNERELLEASTCIVRKERRIRTVWELFSLSIDRRGKLR